MKTYNTMVALIKGSLIGKWRKFYVQCKVPKMFAENLRVKEP